MQSENYNRPEDRWAVVTGASSGIGREIALALAKNGWSVIAHGRNTDRLNAVCDELRDYGAEAHGFTADLSIAAEVKEFAANVRSVTTELKLLVNNAGWASALPLEASEDAVWEKSIGSCLTSTFLCCRELVPLLKKSAPALIMNNASIAARRGFPGFSAYSAAKGGVDAFSRSIREELRGDGVRVTSLFIGATATPLWNEVEGEWDTSKMMDAKSIGMFVAGIAELDPGAVVEECVIMPAGGAL